MLWGQTPTPTSTLTPSATRTPTPTTTSTPTETRISADSIDLLYQSGSGDGLAVDDSIPYAPAAAGAHWVHPSSTTSSCDPSASPGFHEITTTLYIPFDAQSVVRVDSLVASVGPSQWYVNGVIYSDSRIAGSVHRMSRSFDLDNPVLNMNGVELHRGNNTLTIRFLGEVSGCRAASWQFLIQYLPPCVPALTLAGDACPRERVRFSSGTGSRVYRALPGSTPPPDSLGRPWNDPAYVEGSGWGPATVVTLPPPDWDLHCSRFNVPWIGEASNGSSSGADLFVRFVFQAPAEIDMNGVGIPMLHYKVDDHCILWTHCGPLTLGFYSQSPYGYGTGVMGNLMTAGARNCIGFHVFGGRSTRGLQYNLEFVRRMCGSPTATPTPTNPSCMASPGTPIPTDTPTLTWTVTPSVTPTNTPTVAVTGEASWTCTSTPTDTPTPRPTRPPCERDFMHHRNGIAYPNPSYDGRFRFSIGAGERNPRIRWVQVKVRTLSGLLLWEWTGKGENLILMDSVEWDGMSSVGGRLANGVYQVTILAWPEGEREPLRRTRPIVILR